MPKHLKDIIEEGFARLEEIAEQRREILERVERLAENATSSQAEMAESKISEIESEFLTDVVSRSKSMQDRMRHYFEQEVDDKKRLAEYSKENLKIQTNSALANLNQMKGDLLGGAVERLDALFAELKDDTDTAKQSIAAEAENLLSELTSVCVGYEIAMMEAVTEAEKRTSSQYREQRLSSRDLYQDIAKKLSEKREEASRKLHELFDQQKETWDGAAKAPSSSLSPVLREKYENVKDACFADKKEMERLSDEILNSSIVRMKELCRRLCESLEMQQAYSSTAVSKKYERLRELYDRLLAEQRTSVSSLDSDVKMRIYKTYFDLITVDENVVGEGNRMGAGLLEISAELMMLTEEFKTKLSGALNSQVEVLDKMNSTAIKATSRLIPEYMDQLKELIEEEELQCNRKEDELLRQLQGLEQQIKRITSSTQKGGSS